MVTACPASWGVLSRRSLDSRELFELCFTIGFKLMILCRKWFRLVIDVMGKVVVLIMIVLVALPKAIVWCKQTFVSASKSVILDRTLFLKRRYSTCSVPNKLDLVLHFLNFFTVCFYLIRRTFMDLLQVLSDAIIVSKIGFSELLCKPIAFNSIVVLHS